MKKTPFDYSKFRAYLAQKAEQEFLQKHLGIIFYNSFRLSPYMVNLYGKSLPKKMYGEGANSFKYHQIVLEQEYKLTIILN